VRKKKYATRGRQAGLLRMTTAVGHAPATDIESPYAWLRLAVAVTLSAVGGVGM
jgi:hypothetical protein